MSIYCERTGPYVFWATQYNTRHHTESTKYTSTFMISSSWDYPSGTFFNPSEYTIQNQWLYDAKTMSPGTCAKSTFNFLTTNSLTYISLTICNQCASFADFFKIKKFSLIRFKTHFPTKKIMWCSYKAEIFVVIALRDGQV